MPDRSFAVLGLSPTDDRRQIQAAYEQLAGLYDPAQFTGMPRGVREEAERRLSDITAAYEHLRSRRGRRRAMAHRTTWSQADDPVAEALRFRAAAEQLRREAASRSARWEQWEQLERSARDGPRERPREVARPRVSPPPAEAAAPAEPAPVAPERAERPPAPNLLVIHLEQQDGIGSDLAISVDDSSDEDEPQLRPPAAQ